MRHTRNGRYVWDTQRGRLYPVPMGAEGEGDPPGDPKGGESDPKGSGGGDEPVQITQTQLNAMMAREKNQGRQAAQQELADQLGVPLEEAKAILTAARERRRRREDRGPAGQGSGGPREGDGGAGASCSGTGTARGTARAGHHQGRGQPGR
jgi:hypothetical protein